MRRGLALLALLATTHQTSAFGAMQANDCNVAWQEVMKGRMAQATHKISKDGWCQMTNPLGGKVEWRAEGLDRFLQQGVPPTALAIRLTDPDIIRSLELGAKADAPAMPMQITLTLRQNAEARQLLIEGLQINGPKGNMVVLQGVLHDVDLSSVAKMQFSMGSAKLRDVVINAFGNRQLEPYLRPYIGATFPERTRWRSAMIDKVSDWPDHSFPPETKRAVQKLIAVLPAPNGTLRVEVDTGAGLSAGIFMQTFLFGEQADVMLNRALAGVVFHATWTGAE